MFVLNLCVILYFPLWCLVIPTQSLTVDTNIKHFNGKSIHLSYDGSHSIYAFLASGPGYANVDQVWMYSVKRSQFSNILAVDPVNILTAASDINGDIYYFAHSAGGGDSNSTTLYKFDAEDKIVVNVTAFLDLIVIPGFTSLVRLDSLYFLELGGANTSSIHLIKYSFDSKTLKKFKLPETLEELTLSFCGYHVCIFGTTKVVGKSKVLIFDIFRHSFHSWTWKAPVAIASNAFEVGDSVLMFNREYNLVIVNVDRQTVQVESADYGIEEKSWERFTAIYVKEKTSLHIFACAVKTQRCVVYNIYLFLKYTDTRKWIGAVNSTTVTIPCGISGAPLPSVTWVRDGKLLPDVQLDKNSNLVIPSVHFRHTGKYGCIAISFLGHLSREILLTVKHPTQIHDWNTTLSGTSGESILIPCSATSDNLTMHSNWLQNDTEIDWSHSPRYQKVKGSHALLILAAELEDSGNYTCVIKTKVDSVNTTFAVLVENNSVPDSILINDRGHMTSDLLWIVVIGIFAFLALGILISTFCYWKYKNAFRLQETELKKFLLGDAEVENINVLEEFTDGKPYDQSFELELNSFQINRDMVLGFGEFGIVYKGVVMINDKEKAVAFKTCKSAAKDLLRKQLKCLLSELKVMIYIGQHPNIIELVGAYTSKLRQGVAYVAIEFCANGNLEGLLRRSTFVKNLHQYTNTFEEGKSCLTRSTLSTWAHQIASGMEFLGFKRIIHSDLATRNVLVAGDKSIRITDFGLSRRLENYGNYVKMGGEPLPWRWMAVESLDVRSFSPQSDVWSFGVTIWEIYTMGSVPYPGQAWTTDFVQELKKGQRLPQPEFATKEVYAKMRECWAFNSTNRPTFTELVKFFQSLHYKDADIVYLT